MDRPLTAWKHITESGLYGNVDGYMYAAKVLERMATIAPWITMAVESRKEVHACLSVGDSIAHVSITQVIEFMNWAGEELSTLEGPAVGASRPIKDKALDCCALYVMRKILEAADGRVGGMVFTEWPPEDWKAYQAGFIAGVEARGGNGK